ncbi:MAG: tetratricopeptide repeat protein [Muribaculaceae bacterium]|nr:tetratricopeptide repeat protein [Muribaculaceae bacterium]
MKRNTVFIFILFFLSLATLAAAFNPDEDANRKKARYYYLEGVKKAAEGRNAEALEYYKKAYLIDSTYSEAANSYGMQRFWMYTETLQTGAEKAKSLSMMRNFVENYPGDINESLIYGFSSENTDTVPTEALRVYQRLDSLFPGDSRVLLKLAESYDKLGRFDDAIGIFNRMEGKDGKTAQLSLHKISLMLQKGDTVAAIDEVTDLVASNPREPSFRILKGNLYEVIGNNDSTLHYYRQAEEMSPQNGAAKMALANFYKEQGDSVAYDNKIYEALLTEDFELEDKLSIMGEYLQTLFTEKNDKQRGDYLFNVLMEQYPHESSMLELAARYSAAKGAFAEASQYISYAIDQDPTNMGFWEMLMRFQYLDEKPKEALATFIRAKESTPEEDKELPDSMKLLYAAAATAAEEYDKAIDTYADMIHQISPSLPLTDSITDKKALASLTYDNLMALNSLYQMLGDTYYQMKKPDLTFRVYDNALFFNPESPLTLNNYAYFLTETGGDLDKAYNYITKAIQADGENPTFLDTYAWVLFKRKEFGKALEYQKKALEILEKSEEEVSAEYYHHLGDILFMNHEPEEALKNWEKALKLEPENALLKKKVAHKTFFFE